MAEPESPVDQQIGLLTGWISLVLGEAPRLRAAGVLSIGCGGLSVTFAALPEPPLVPTGEIAAPDATVPTDGLDALNDPHSYPGGVVPGFKITKYDRIEIPEE